MIDRRILILLLLMPLWLGGCMKEEYPKHAIATEQSLQTIKDVEAWSWGYGCSMRSLNSLRLPHYSVGCRATCLCLALTTAIGAECTTRLASTRPPTSRTAYTLYWRHKERQFFPR